LSEAFESVHDVFKHRGGEVFHQARKQLEKHRRHVLRSLIQKKPIRHGGLDHIAQDRFQSLERLFAAPPHLRGQVLGQQRCRAHVVKLGQGQIEPAHLIGRRQRFVPLHQTPQGLGVTGAKRERQPHGHIHSDIVAERRPEIVLPAAVQSRLR